MEYLPTIIDKKRTYAGFWVRLGAAVIDFLIIFPIYIAVFQFQSLNIILAVVLAIVSAAFFPMYNVYFNAVYGGTIGKLAMKIRITKPNGSKIGWREAWYRSSVDLVFAVLFLIIALIALFSVDWTAYQAAEFFDRLNLLVDRYPSWYDVVEYGNSIWVWGELIVLLFNKRRRAIHDYIAGTVVIHKEFIRERSA